MLEVMLVKKYVTRALTTDVDVSVSQDGFISLVPDIVKTLSSFKKG